MAIYLFRTKVVGRKAKSVIIGALRARRETSVVAKAAYSSGDRLKDERINTTFNYRYKQEEVAWSEILVPKEGREWLKVDEFEGKTRELRQHVWNAVERSEKRSDSQVARSILLALPSELSEQENVELVRDWCTKEFVDHGYIADFSMHRPTDGGRNIHAHILVNMRPLGPEGFGKKPSMQGKFKGRGVVGEKTKAELGDYRKSWEDFANLALEKAGRPERIDCRSLKEQGIDRIPQPHIGPEVTAMQRKGVLIDHPKLEEFRHVQLANEDTPLVRAAEGRAEEPLQGFGESWWERSVTFMSCLRHKASEALKGYWQRFVENRQVHHPDADLDQGR